MPTPYLGSTIHLTLYMGPCGSQHWTWPVDTGKWRWKRETSIVLHLVPPMDFLNSKSFELCNAPATFQHLMDVVLAGLQWSSCLVYLDDIIILGKDFKSHLENFHWSSRESRMLAFGLKATKCAFFQDRVNYLGHVVWRDGVSMEQLIVNKVKNWPVPTISKEVQQFLGLANFYRRFVQGFANTARPLHRLTEKTAKFNWTAGCQAAFDELRPDCVITQVSHFLITRSLSS